MKLWHISDTHGLHEQLPVPNDVEVVVHSGDASNNKNPYINEKEFRNFLAWFSNLSIPHKIFVPGNHETSFERNLVRKDELIDLGITPLVDSGTEISGIKIWGSPWVPRYGEWAWMVGRGSLNKKWQNIPEDTDVLVTHGPPFSCLDATYSRQNDIELVGCRALQKRVMALRLEAHLFGHVHSDGDLQNNGTRTMLGLKTVFSNGSCCHDGVMEKITSVGNILEVSKMSE